MRKIRCGSCETIAFNSGGYENCLRSLGWTVNLLANWAPKFHKDARSLTRVLFHVAKVDISRFASTSTVAVACTIIVDINYVIRILVEASDVRRRLGLNVVLVR